MKRAWLLLGMVVLFFAGADALTVTFPAQVTVNGERIMLAEIAQIEGTPAEVATLNDIVLGEAPVLGTSVAYSEGRIRVRLRQYHLVPEQMTIVCPKTVCITRKARQREKLSITSIAEQWLHTHAPAMGHDAVTFAPVSDNIGVPLPEGVIASTCTLLEAGSANLLSVQVNIAADNRMVWNGVVSFHVHRFAEVLITRKSLARNALLTADDAMLERLDIAEVRGTPLTTMAQLAHCRATTSLPAGTVLTTANIELAPTVKRNDDVRVTAACGALLVSAHAVACEDGIPGAIIRVRNPLTHQEYQARVTGVDALEAVVPVN